MIQPIMSTTKMRDNILSYNKRYYRGLKKNTIIGF